MERQSVWGLLLAAIWVAGTAQAQTCTNIATGNWGTPGTWSCTLPPGPRVPTAADDVVIINNSNVTVNIAGAIAGSLTIAGGNRGTSVNMGGAGTTLTVTNAGGRSGNVVINAPSGRVTKQLAVGARTLNVTGSVTIGSASAGGNNRNIAQLTVGSGTAVIGSLAVAGGTVNSIARATVTTGVLSVAGDANVNSGTLGRAHVLLTNNGTIDVGGNLAISSAASTGNSGDATVEVTNAGGLLNVSGNTIVTGGAAGNRDALLRVTAASNPGRGISIGGALTIDATVANSSSVTLGNGSRMTVNGNVNNGDQLSVGAGLFSTNSTLTTRNPLMVAVTSVSSGTLSVGGDAVVGPGGVGASTLTVATGLISIAGNLDVTAEFATGNNGDATARVTGSGRMDVGGNVTVTGGSNNQRDALLTVTGASGAGQGINITGTLTIDSTVAGSSTVSLTNAASRMTVGGSLRNNDLVNVGAGNLTVAGDYTNNNQAFAVRTTLSTGTLTVGGVLTNSATETIAISSTGVINGNGGFVNSGTFTNSNSGQLFLRGTTNTVNGTFNDGVGTVTMNGSAPQMLAGTALFPPTAAADGFYNLVIDNAAGVTLGSSVVARNVITLASGEVNTGAHVLIAEAGCATPSVVRVAGHVVGNFQKRIPAGASTCNFEIGSAGAYAPVSLTFNGVAAGGGRLIAHTAMGDHPNVGTSGFNVARTVNRWWALTTAGVTGTALPAFTNYGATFTFINPGDLDAGVNPLLFETKRWTGAAWNTTTAGSRTATTTQANGIVALGEFAIGESAVPAPGRFNAFETSTGAGAIVGVIRTRRAGVPFSLDLVAISGGAQLAGFTDAVQVELLGNNALGVALDVNNCPTASTILQSASPNPTITAGRSTVNFAAVANSWRDVRVRIRWPVAAPTVTSCSTDNFAIRPDAITGFAASNDTRTTAGLGNALDSTAFGALVHNAGRPFSVRAIAVNGAGSPAVTTNYAGSPLATLTACGPGPGFEACRPAPSALTLTTSFAAGVLASDTAAYNDVGSFNLQLLDDDFASVDASDGSSVAERRVASPLIAVGRFVPDSFAVAFNLPVLAPACTGFTYMGQAFNYSTPPVITLTAQAFGGGTTAGYTGAWWRLTNSTITPAAQSGRYATASGALDTAGLPSPALDPAIADSGNGSGTLSFSGGTGFRYTRDNAAPAAEFDAEIALSVNVIDADGVAAAANPAAFGAASAGNGMLFSDADALTTNDKRMRYGRLQLGSKSGSQILDLRVPVEAQFWNGIAFTTNILDNCTALTAGNVGLGNFIGGLAPGETTVTVTDSPLRQGRGTIELTAPGAGNHGSVDLTLNLGAGANADACDGLAPAAAAGDLAHLRGRWCDPPGTYTKDPSARARFGISGSRGRAIDRRER